MPMSQTEAHRLAAAINQLRPEWPAASLSSFIHKNLTGRAYRDAAVALTWVATDPESLTPARILEAGPWWKATQAQAGTVSAVVTDCPEHPGQRAGRCQPCDDAATTTDHAKGAAAVRAAIATAPPPPRTDRPDQEKKP